MNKVCEWLSVKTIYEFVCLTYWTLSLEDEEKEEENNKKEK